MKQKLIVKILNRVLVILGFATTTSCMYGTSYMEMIEMYGTPTMDFEVSGKVVNKEDSPIAGIKVSCCDVEPVFTAEDGSFSIADTDYCEFSNSVQLIFEDIDGPENGGEFADMSSEIQVNQVKKGDGSWYRGAYEAKDVVIRMKDKEQE